MSQEDGPSGAHRGSARPTLLHRAGAAAASVSSIGPTRPRARLAAQWGLATLIFGCLIFFVLRQWSTLPDFDWRFRAGWLAAAVPAGILFYVLHGEIWRRIVGALGTPVALAPAWSIWGKTLLARYVPTGALMVVGRVVMTEKLGVPKRVTLASLVYEVGIALGSAVIAGAYFVIELPALEGESARYAILGVLLLVLAGLHPRVFGPIANFALGKLDREPLPRTLEFRHVLSLTALYLVSWAAIGISTFAFASALYPVELGDLPYITASYAVAFCVAVLTFVVPGGLGTRDAALASAMALVLPAAVAGAIAVGFRLFQTAIELLYVVAVTGLDRLAAGRTDS